VSLNVGDILCVALEGQSIADRERDFFVSSRPAGLTLFQRNIAQPTEKLLELNQELQSLRGKNQPPLIISIDQEGGRVDRFKRADFPNLGVALNLRGGGTTQEDIDAIYQYGELIGSKLQSFGVNINFAPVCDIDTEATNSAIGDRCFGKTVDQVVPRAKAFLNGMQSTGVLGCLKHFPGQGDAKADTHLSAASIPLSLDKLKNREFRPFAELIPLTQMVMISHCIYPALDSVEAGLSKVVMNDLLRGKMGFSGVIVSDDMTMHALSQEPGAWEQSLISAVLAGVDLLLV